MRSFSKLLYELPKRSSTHLKAKLLTTDNNIPSKAIVISNELRTSWSEDFLFWRQFYTVMRKWYVEGCMKKRKKGFYRMNLEYVAGM